MTHYNTYTIFYRPSSAQGNAIGHVRPSVFTRSRRSFLTMNASYDVTYCWLCRVLCAKQSVRPRVRFCRLFPSFAFPCLFASSLFPFCFPSLLSLLSSSSPLPLFFSPPLFSLSLSPILAFHLLTIIFPFSSPLFFGNCWDRVRYAAGFAAAPRCLG